MGNWRNWQDVPINFLATGVRTVYSKEMTNMDSRFKGFGRFHRQSLRYWDEFTKQAGSIWFKIAKYAKGLNCNPLDFVIAQFYFINTQQGMPFPTQMSCDAAITKYRKFIQESPYRFSNRLQCEIKGVNGVVWDCVHHMGYPEPDAVLYAIIEKRCTPISSLVILSSYEDQRIKSKIDDVWYPACMQYARFGQACDKAISNASLNVDFPYDVLSRIRKDSLDIRRCWCGLQEGETVAI